MRKFAIVEADEREQGILNDMKYFVLAELTEDEIKSLLDEINSLYDANGEGYNIYALDGIMEKLKKIVEVE